MYDYRSYFFLDYDYNHDYTISKNMITIMIMTTM